MPVSEQLRKAIVAAGETHYRIAKETGLHAIALDRFVSGERSNIRIDTVDRLCDYFGLELAPRQVSALKGTGTARGTTRAGAATVVKQRRNRSETASQERPKSKSASAAGRRSRGTARGGTAPT